MSDYERNIGKIIKIKFDLIGKQANAYELLGREGECADKNYKGDHTQQLLDNYWEKYICIDDVWYEIHNKEIEIEESYFKAEPCLGGFAYDVQYYNGGCGLSEGIEEAMENLAEKTCVVGNEL